MKLKLPTVIGLAVVVSIAACSGARNDATSPVVSVPGTVGVRNFRQLSAKLSAATGVDPTDFGVTGVFTGVKTRLSVDGVVQKVSPAMLLAATTLAGEYCLRFIEQEAVRTPDMRRIHGPVNFQGDLGTFNVAVRQQMIHAYAQVFWLRDTDDSELNELTQLMATVAAENKAPAEVIVDSLLAACTAVAGSLEVLKI
jgi:hypothetical protein